MKLIKDFLIIFAFILGLIIITSTLSYINIININKIINLIFISLFIFIYSLKMTNKKNIEGIKIAIILIITGIILRIIFRKSLITNILNYIVIFFSSVLGSIIGIKKKVKKRNT